MAAFQKLEERARSLFAATTTTSSLTVVPDILHVRDSALTPFSLAGGSSTVVAQ